MPTRQEVIASLEAKQAKGELDNRQRVTLSLIKKREAGELTQDQQDKFDLILSRQKELSLEASAVGGPTPLEVSTRTPTAGAGVEPSALPEEATEFRPLGARGAREFFGEKLPEELAVRGREIAGTPGAIVGAGLGTGISLAEEATTPAAFAIGGGLGLLGAGGVAAAQIPGVQRVAKEAGKRILQVPGVKRVVRKAVDIATTKIPIPGFRKPVKVRKVNFPVAEKAQVPIVEFMDTVRARAVARETRAAGKRLVGKRGELTKVVIQGDNDVTKAALDLIDVKQLKRSSPEQLLKVARSEILPDRNTWWRRIAHVWQPSSEVMSKIGVVGKELTKRYTDSLLTYMVRAGHSNSVIRSFTRRMSDIEKENFVAVLNGIARPISDNVRRSFVVTRAMLDKVAKEAEAVGTFIGFRKNFFPRFYPADWFKAGPAREQAIKKIMKSQKLDRAKAANILDRISRNNVSQYGPLEKHRFTDLDGWIKDPEAVLSRYFQGAFKRIEFARSFGPNNEKAATLISGIKEAGNRNLADATLAAMTGITEKGAISSFVRDSADIVRNQLTRRFMALSAINNADQGVYGAFVKRNASVALRGFRRAFDPMGKEFARDSGVLLNDFAEAFGNATKTRDFLVKNRFIQSEQFARTVAGNAERFYLNDMLKILKNPRRIGEHKQALEELEKLGIDGKAAVKRGFFSRNEVDKAANKLVKDTQFLFIPGEMPLLYNTPMGRILYHLRTFDVGWFRLAREHAFGSLWQGNPKPLLKLIGYGMLGGEVKANIWSAITDRERPDIIDEPIRRMTENMAFASSLGVASVIFDSRLGAFGKGPVTRLALPTAVSFGDEVANAAFNPEQIPSFLVRRVITPAVVGRFGLGAGIATRAVGERVAKGLTE